MSKHTHKFIIVVITFTLALILYFTVFKRYVETYKNHNETIIYNSGNSDNHYNSIDSNIAQEECVGSTCTIKNKGKKKLY